MTSKEPGFLCLRVTFGFTRRLQSGSEINFAAFYAPRTEVSGANPLDPAQTIELSMQQFEAELSWTWYFD